MTPVERAARALCALSGEDPDAPAMQPGFQREVRQLRRPGDGPFNWQRFIPHARAVITAIREPSEAMLGSTWVKPGSHHVASEDQAALAAGDAWQAMIDAALEEGQ